MTQDIIIRQQIWLSLSEFYLDIELTDDDIKRIAGVFYLSGFELDAIKEIDIYEVFPVVQTNLFSAAGSWAGFDNEWLFSECEKRYKKRQNWFHRNVTAFWNRLFYWMRKDYWNKVDYIFFKLKRTNPNKTRKQ